MASMKAEKPVGTQLFGKKEPLKTSTVAPKAAASKSAPKKAAPKPEPKKKAALKGGKAAAKP